MTEISDPIKHAVDAANKVHEEKSAKDKENHLKAMNTATHQITHLNNTIELHTAEKMALNQSVNEFLTANIKLRATGLLLDKQTASHVKKIEKLTKDIEDKDAVIKDLQTRLEVANKVIATTTNLVPPVKAPIPPEHAKDKAK